MTRCDSGAAARSVYQRFTQYSRIMLRWNFYLRGVEAKKNANLPQMKLKGKTVGATA